MRDGVTRGRGEGRVTRGPGRGTGVTRDRGEGRGSLGGRGEGRGSLEAGVLQLVRVVEEPLVLLQLRLLGWRGR